MTPKSVTAKKSARASKQTAKPSTPLVSIVIPVYNEESLLFGSIVELHERMGEFDFPYEILVCENGSTDNTVEIGMSLERRYAEVRLLRSPEPNYGAALRMGIEKARGTFVINDEIDILDTRFYQRSLDLLRADQCDLVVGSKLHPDSQDKRPKLRHSATHIINFLLRISLGFKGSDTHGLKSFHRERLMPVVDACIVDKDLFASEFVIRAERGAFRIVEVPVEIIEKRTPSINLFRRVPTVFRNLAQLVYTIRIKG